MKKITLEAASESVPMTIIVVACFVVGMAIGMAVNSMLAPSHTTSDCEHVARIEYERVTPLRNDGVEMKCEPLRDWDSLVEEAAIWRAKYSQRGEIIDGAHAALLEDSSYICKCEGCKAARRLLGEG